MSEAAKTEGFKGLKPPTNGISAAAVGDSASSSAEDGRVFSDEVGTGVDARLADIGVSVRPADTALIGREILALIGREGDAERPSRDLPAEVRFFFSTFGTAAT
jgi:hypothetical protein